MEEELIKVYEKAKAGVQSANSSSPADKPCDSIDYGGRDGSDSEEDEDRE